jgi:hypothetical protein
MERVSPVAYCIRIPHLLGIYPVLSIAHLKLFKETSKLQTDLSQLHESPEKYEVLEIVNQKTVKQGKKHTCLLYQCQWKGYSITDGWVTENDLHNAPEVLHSWKENLKSQQA